MDRSVITSRTEHENAKWKTLRVRNDTKSSRFQQPDFCMGDGPTLPQKNGFDLDAVLHFTVSTSSKHYVIPI